MLLQRAAHRPLADLVRCSSAARRSGLPTKAKETRQLETGDPATCPEKEKCRFFGPCWGGLGYNDGVQAGDNPILGITVMSQSLQAARRW